MAEFKLRADEGSEEWKDQIEFIQRIALTEEVIGAKLDLSRIAETLFRGDTIDEDERDTLMAFAGLSPRDFRRVSRIKKRPILDEFELAER